MNVLYITQSISVCQVEEFSEDANLTVIEK